MANRKTIHVNELRERINALLDRPEEDIGDAPKAVLCSLLESVLMNTGNYWGFGWHKLTAEQAQDMESADPGYYTRRYYGRG